MSSKLIELNIVSAHSAIFSGSVSHLIVNGINGELGIYPGHTALLTSLKPGQVKTVADDGSENVFYISGGMLEVQPYSVTVLADTAFRADDIDEAAALAAKEKAEKALDDNRSELEYSKALSELAQAVAQLRAINTSRKHGRNVKG